MDRRVTTLTRDSPEPWRVEPGGWNPDHDDEEAVMKALVAALWAINDRMSEIAAAEQSCLDRLAVDRLLASLRL
jgi:hypothetical protein